MYFTVDPRGVILSVNRYGAGELGYHPRELIGRRVTEVVHEVDRREFLARLRQCIRDPSGVQRWEFRKVHRSGEIIWVREVARAVPQEKGKGPVVLLVCENISELKRMEEMLRRAREELEQKVELQMKRADPYGLTFRELTILNLIATGQSDKEIANLLGISPQTVHKHVSHILRRMGASSRTEAGLRALREGLVG
jgi:PAS domain S-box-containing protein